MAIFVAGFLLEAVADWQKEVWRAVPSNRGRWIDSGLWSWSRHPNYAGEIALWTGMAVLAAAGLAPDAGAVAAAAISPCFVAFLLTKVSGIPLLEAAAQKKWGKLKEYQAYKERVRVL